MRNPVTSLGPETYHDVFRHQDRHTETPISGNSHGMLGVRHPRRIPCILLEPLCSVKLSTSCASVLQISVVLRPKPGNLGANEREIHMFKVPLGPCFRGGRKHLRQALVCGQDHGPHSEHS